ncbi:hypothetical protein LBMAG21_07920 [Armatimonadota bacterium]|nr:hypothetical protein LBMAG21_07920 [Armatimonadota bacterium]
MHTVEYTSMNVVPDTITRFDATGFVSSERYIPQGVTMEISSTLARAVVYLGKSESGSSFAVAYTGEQDRHDCVYTFPSSDRAVQWANQFLFNHYAWNLEQTER